MGMARGEAGVREASGAEGSPDAVRAARMRHMIEAMPRVSSPVFVGRHAELERLSGAFAGVVDGCRPATRIVAGDAGIGKTRLIGEFIHQTERAGARALIGDCVQVGETGLPFGPIVSALRPLVHGESPRRLDALLGHGRGELARLLPDLGASNGSDGGELLHPRSAVASQARLFEVVYGLLRRLADEAPLVVVLEDLHWADPSTRDLLRFLVRSARGARILFVVSYRSDELHRRHPLRPLLADLERHEGVETIELAGFRAAELSEQLTGITGSQPTAELVARVLARSGGNPFITEELMADGATGLTLSRTLRDMLEERVRRLTPGAQTILRLASVGGARLDHQLLAAVADVPETELNAALREAVDHHLLAASDPAEAPGYAFRHALVHEVVYDELLPGERTRLHARYAAALEDDERFARLDPAGTAAQLAGHWMLAHDLPRALASAVRAAEAAATGSAFGEAQALLERALSLWGKVAPPDLPDGLDRVSLLETAAEAAAQTGDSRRAIDLALGALEEVDAVAEPSRAGVINHRLATYYNEAGDWEAGARALERAMGMIPIDPPSPERARVVADLAHSYMTRNRFSESLALAEAALAISRSVGAEIAEARALNAMGLDFACRSDPERGIPILRDAYRLAHRLDDPQTLFLCGVGLGWALDETARHAEALGVAVESRDRIAVLGASARYGALFASKMSRALWELGRWDEAARVIDEAIDGGPSRYALRWLLSNRLRLDIWRGAFDLAERDFAAYEALGERVMGPDPDLMSARRAEYALAQGRTLDARRFVADTLGRLPEPEVDNDGRTLALLGLETEAEEAERARADGDLERLATATAVATELRARVTATAARIEAGIAQPAEIVQADALLAAALFTEVSGADAASAWELAVEARRTLGRPHELAVVLTHLATAYLTDRRRGDAGTALAEAHPIAIDLGAGPLNARIEALARRAGIGLEGVETADEAADRLRLTAREREVLALLAEGRSNRLIGEALYMAESTAGVHVSNILGKLQVERRSEAAAVAHRLGLPRA
jgi:DNA-binding NarL/FixJ family response regulator